VAECAVRRANARYVTARREIEFSRIGGVPTSVQAVLPPLNVPFMRTAQFKWTKSHGWAPHAPSPGARPAQLVLVFGAPAALRESGVLAEVAAAYPEAQVLGCSTAGEIAGVEVLDDSLVLTAISFEHTPVRAAQVRLDPAAGSGAAGEALAQALPADTPAGAGGEREQLTHVFVLSDGLQVNGSELVRGLARRLPADVTVTGGLAGDGARFGQTLVMLNGAPASGTIAAVGFYGPRLKIGYGSLGGWDSFGPDRLITRSQGNVLYELDGISALGLYKKYLGEHAAGLPATGLLFPLSLRTSATEPPVVRTILSVDEAEQTLTFAGDVPEGSHARLMKANFDRLIDGAVGAAHTGRGAIGGTTPELAILISCVGRKLVLHQRIEEEVEGVRDVLGPQAMLAGFYSYGEISPFTPGARCELHNQTMTITTFAEA
jgi:hypothetical protein